MKIQYLAVIFVIIIIPISFVMSQYIQTQIDTIELQTAYTKNLNTATHDALKAFQINSINNKYSSISDSKIRDVEAAINTFYNSLGTAMDMYISSREQLVGYIPAVVFTLYDGYYINSTYENIYSTKGEEDEAKVEILDSGEYQEGLRPYIYYSAKYRLSNGKIVVVNYTLDNAITIYGDIGNGYETLSGYLIDPNKVKNINTANKTLVYNNVEIGPEILTEHLITVDDEGKTKEGDYNYIIYNNQKIYEDINDSKTPTGEYFWYMNNKKTYLQNEKASIQKYIRDNGGFHSVSAFEYYYNAKIFSEKVNNSYLANVKQKDMIKMDGGETTIGNDTEYLAANTGEERIFATSGNSSNDPMLASSTFDAHRVAVIRKSIETNLSTAIANYTKHNNLSTYDFRLPVIDEINWYNIANNVTVISFMQGLPIGMKYYNNYSVITNTKNEEVVNNQTIYLVTTDASGNNREYHQPGCKELIDSVNSGRRQIDEAYTVLSFQRQTVKISESSMRYFYPQARVNKATTGCYNCIVNATADYDIDEIIKGEVRDHLSGNLLYGEASLKAVRKTYLTALARERYDLYKSNSDLK